MSTLSGKHILVGISGGIAAYKVPELLRLLIKAGAEVKVTTTRNALQFVTPLTLRTLTGHEVYSDVFAAVNSHSTEHISLPEWADVMLVAPATENVLCKMATGIADDALTTTFAATVAHKPVVLAPAMNDRMYANPATQQALRTLSSWSGVTIVDCAEGFLACGTSGKGRMQEIDVLQEAVISALTPKTLLGKHVMLTAGPTREPLDPVRYLSNYSTGKMGYALARECLRRGAQVTLISGPCTASTDGLDAYASSLQMVPVVSAQDMYEAAIHTWPKADIAILSAAVADFTPVEVADQKRKKQPGQTTMSLTLTLTHDIAASLGQVKRPDQRLVGFALETEQEQDNALKKLRSKSLDFIVLNSLRDAGAGFGYDTNKVTFLCADGTQKNLPLMDKQEVAGAILDQL